MKFLVIINLIALSQALTFGTTNFRKELVSELPVESEPISPYAFSYTAEATDGASARQESADASGVVRGSYSLVSADGIKRIVNYIADKDGFRAQVQTNEPGTESKSSANVLMESSQLPAEEIALKYGPRPDLEIKPVVQTLKGVSNSILLNRPLLENIPLQTKLETVLPEEKLTQSFIPIPTFQSNIKQLESPIRLLSRLPKIRTLNTNFKPIGEQSLQNQESF